MSPFSVLETQQRINSLFGVIGLSVYGNTTQHIAKLGQYLGLCQSQILV